MPIYLLLAMQAAGMVVDYFGTRQQDQLMKQGMKIQQAGFETDLAQTRLASQNDSLAAMKQLRQNLGSQIAVMAARGTNPGAGSAFSILNESQGNFNADETIRKMNLLGKENQLRGQSALSKLQYSGDSSKLWQGFASRTFNKFSSSASAYSQGFGMTQAAGA